MQEEHVALTEPSDFVVHDGPREKLYSRLAKLHDENKRFRQQEVELVTAIKERELRLSCAKSFIDHAGISIK